MIGAIAGDIIGSSFEHGSIKSKDFARTGHDQPAIRPEYRFGGVAR